MEREINTLIWFIETLGNIEMKTKRILITLYFIVFSISVNICTGQKKYFEYQNSEAIRLSKTELKLLTSKDWYPDVIEDKIRNDTILTTHFNKIKYNFDGSYLLGKCSGQWSIKYNKYIEHLSDSNRNCKTYEFGGIYSILVLNDSALVITKLMTSSQDMKRTIFFTDKIKDKPIHLIDKEEKERDVDSFKYREWWLWDSNNTDCDTLSYGKTFYDTMCLPVEGEFEIFDAWGEKRFTGLGRSIDISSLDVGIYYIKFWEVEIINNKRILKSEKTSMFIKKTLPNNK